MANNILKHKKTLKTQLFAKLIDPYEGNWVLSGFWNSLYIAFLLLPLGINLPTPFFIISIILGSINILRSKLKFRAEDKILLLFPLYFLILALGLLWTDNLKEGINILTRSLTLFLFPIIFLFVKEDASTVKKLFNFLLIGIIISFIINFVWTIFKTWLHFEELESSKSDFLALGSHLLSYVLKSNFSNLINANYEAIYVLLVLSYILKYELKRVSQILIIIVLFSYIFLLASKASYLILFLIALLYISSISELQKKFFIIVILGLGTTLFLLHPRLSPSVVYNLLNIDKVENKEETYKLHSWVASFQAAKNSPWIGYGTGDANDQLIQKYQELDFDYNFKNRYNAHNQFLQTYLQTGLIGFTVLLWIFVVLVIRLRKSRNEFAVFLIFFISLFFESMLVRFNGIVFFSVILPLLLKKRSILSSRIIRNIK